MSICMTVLRLRYYQVCSQSSPYVPFDRVEWNEKKYLN